MVRPAQTGKIGPLKSDSGGLWRVDGSHGLNKWFEMDCGGSDRSKFFGPAVSITDRTVLPIFIF
jgi:hypothetical protein